MTEDWIRIAWPFFGVLTVAYIVWVGGECRPVTIGTIFWWVVAAIAGPIGFAIAVSARIVTWLCENRERVLFNPCKWWKDK